MTNQTNISIDESGTVHITHSNFVVVIGNGTVSVTPLPCPEAPADPYVCEANPEWPEIAENEPLRYSFVAGEGDGSVGFRNDQYQQYGVFVSGEPEYEALQASRNASGFLGLNFKPTFASNYIDPQARVIGPNGEDISGGWVDLSNTADGYYASVASPALVVDAVYCVEFRGALGAE